VNEHILPVVEGWRRHRLKWCFLSCRNGVWGDEPNGENDIPVVRVADFDRMRLRVNDNVPTLRSISLQERVSRELTSRDLLIEKSGGGDLQPVGVVVSYDLATAAVYSNFIARLEVAPTCCPRFLTYLNAFLYDHGINQRSIKQTTGIQTLDAASYLNELVSIPGETTQRMIGDYLDRETAEIDALIAEKQRMLALLNEKRAAMITHAVTCGLNPKVRLKPSGFDWLGDVPKHWRVERLKFHLAQRIEQGWSPVCESRPADDDEWAVLKVGCVNGDRFNPEEHKALPADLEPEVRYEIQENDILLSRGNTLELVGSASVVPRVRPKLLLCDLLYRCRVATSRILPEFAVHQLRSTVGRFQIEQEASGSSGSMKKIGQETIQNFVLMLPPLEEQEQILATVRAATVRIDMIRDVTTDSIRLLRERRSALITAAVTGQIPIEEMTA